METLYATGIRRTEACNLNLYDVDTARMLLLVREGKGKRDRIVPLTEAACYWLTRYITEAREELMEWVTIQVLRSQDLNSYLAG